MLEFSVLRIIEDDNLISILLTFPMVIRSACGFIPLLTRTWVRLELSVS